MKEGPAWFFSLLLFCLWPCSPSCFFALSAFYPCDLVPPVLLQSSLFTSLYPQPASLASLVFLVQCTSLGFPSSFSLWYRGETETPEAETSNTAPGRLQQEEAPQQRHPEPAGSLPAPNS